MIQLTAHEQCQAFNTRYQGLTPEEEEWHKFLESTFYTLKYISVALILPSYYLSFFRKQILTHPNEIIIYGSIIQMITVAAIWQYFDYCDPESWKLHLLQKTLPPFNWPDSDQDLLRGMLLFVYILFMKHAIEFGVTIVTIIYAVDLIMTIRSPLSDLSQRARTSLVFTVVATTLFFVYSFSLYLALAKSGKSMAFIFYSYIFPLRLIITIFSCLICIYALFASLTGILLRKGFNRSIQRHIFTT